MSSRPSVVVVVPAHDESETIVETLDSIAAAVRHARRRRVIGAATVQVVAHRCSDETAALARACMRRCAFVEVVEDVLSTTVGQVRDHGARRGLLRLSTAPDEVWVLSTDADSRVPRDWIVQVLVQAGQHRAVAVVGLATLDMFRGSDPARAAYQSLIDSKLIGGDGLRRHDHVYGANLAIRADAYLAVGGFPHVGHGEDQRLVDLLLDSGVRVLRTPDIVVVTSGRHDGRAADGLATLLRALDVASHVSGDQTWARHLLSVKDNLAMPTVER